MILHVYNIRDERQGTYGTPVFTQFDVDQMAQQYEATIVATQAKVDRISEVLPSEAAKAVMEAASLKDCVVYHIGTFDNKSGEFVPDDPLLVCRLSDYFREVSKNA